MNFMINSSPVKQVAFTKPGDGSSIIPTDIDTTWTLEVRENDLVTLGTPSTTSWWQIVRINGVDHTDGSKPKSHRRHMDPM
jgi:hypothetical protein